VQALRETGSIDLRMENDLLRAELMEHKNFISRFKRIADGLPTSHSAKKVMLQQGSDTAVAQVLGLLSTSMADPSWQVGCVKDHPEIVMRYQRLPHGESAEGAKRCSVRLDVPVIPCEDPAILANIIWRTWCQEDLNQRISKHFGAVSVSVREIDTGTEDLENAVVAPLLDAETLPGGGGGSAGSSGSTATTINNNLLVAHELAQRNKVKVYYYREESESARADVKGVKGENDVVDTVLLLSARIKPISRSSFPQEERFHKFPPRILDPRLEPVAPALTLEQQQGLHAQKNLDAIVLASTSTQHSLGLVQIKPGVHRIRSALLEGSVFRKVEGGVAMSSVVSYPTTVSDASRGKHDPLVTNEGYLNDVWSLVISEIYSIVREQMPAYVFDKYREFRDQGAVLPNEILEYL
jgi:hypothetical protein